MSLPPVPSGPPAAPEDHWPDGALPCPEPPCPEPPCPEPPCPEPPSPDPAALDLEPPPVEPPPVEPPPLDPAALDPAAPEAPPGGPSPEEPNGAGIRGLPRRERPRERLLASGAGSLSEAELLAVLLRTGRPGVSAVALARQLLAERGGLSGLVGARAPELIRPGLGPAKAAALLAAVELGQRLARQSLPRREPLARPSQVVSYLATRYRLRDQEVVGALYLDARNRLVAEREVFRGTLDRTIADPREILREALLLGASGVVLFHTHPSGDPSPSVEDLAFTRRLDEAAEVLGLRLADHLIVGDAGRWVSLRQRGGW